MYSSTGCSTLDDYYEALQLNVVTTGYYRLVGHSNISLHVYIYHDTFYPSDPFFNLRTDHNADVGFRLGVVLESNSTYVLVVTSASPSEQGSFSIDSQGPANIRAHHICKFVSIFALTG